MVKSTTEKNQNRIKIKAVLLGIVALLVVTMSLFHVFFKENTDELISHKKTYTTIIKNRDNHKLGIINNHVNTLIAKYPNDKALKELALNLKTDYTKGHNNFINEIKNYKKKSQLLADNQSFMGRANFRFWIWIFGLTIALLFFAVKSLYHDLANKKNKYRLDLISYAGISVGFFWLLHILFLTQKDFSKNTYVALILACAILCAFATYYITKHFTYKDVLIEKLFSFIERVKNIHVRKLGTKALYAERNNEAMPSATLVEHDLKIFDNELSSAINE